MSAASVQLDKTITTEVDSALGTIVIRAVVLAKKAKQQVKAQAIPADAEADEAYPDVGEGPLDSYLENPRHGKGYAVFLVNGQRHHAWDNTFIIRDLNLKYLRNRTMVVVDLDGLAIDAISEIMQGSRQGLYEGRVYHAIRDRVVATLRKDPDLEKLEDAAEQEISELRAGDEAVKKTLDQLIADHHSAAIRIDQGHAQPGVQGGLFADVWGQDRRQDVVIQGDATMGSPATGPVLVLDSQAASVRLRPNDSRVLRVQAQPAAAWATLKNGIHVEVTDAFDGLTWQIDNDTTGATIRFAYTEPAGLDSDEYPLEAGVRIAGRFDGFAEPRLIEHRLIASIPGPPPPPPPPPQLVDPPTYIRVTSRQPVRLTVNGADTHVRLKWDGKDSLTIGSPPAWTFHGRCATIPAYPPVAFSRPSAGRFEMLIPAPVGLSVGQKLTFEIEANGPNGMRLSTTLSAEVVEPPEPRKIKAEAPDTTAQRRPPYELKILKREQWETVECWGGRNWTGDDAACFKEPTATKPLTLIINEDMTMLRAYRDTLLQRKLAEATITERVTRYTSHVAFHLYQMYLHLRKVRDAMKADPNLKEPEDEAMAQEVNRVSATLVKLMEVSR